MKYLIRYCDVYVSIRNYIYFSCLSAVFFSIVELQNKYLNMLNSLLIHLDNKLKQLLENALCFTSPLLST